MIEKIFASLNNLSLLLKQLDCAAYIRPCLELENASIGQHTRHIIELFQCLIEQYDSGVVNYDKRKRNTEIETNIDFALKAIEALFKDLAKENKPILLSGTYIGDSTIETNYERELLYNLEHCIHHQALIKVAVSKLANVEVSSDFGIAASTLEYRKRCVQ